MRRSLLTALILALALGGCKKQSKQATRTATKPQTTTTATGSTIDPQTVSTELPQDLSSLGQQINAAAKDYVQTGVKAGSQDPVDAAALELSGRSPEELTEALKDPGLKQFEGEVVHAASQEAEKQGRDQGLWYGGAVLLSLGVAGLGFFAFRYGLPALRARYSAPSLEDINGARDALLEMEGQKWSGEFQVGKNRIFVSGTDRLLRFGEDKIVWIEGEGRYSVPGPDGQKIPRAQVELDRYLDNRQYSLIVDGFEKRLDSAQPEKFKNYLQELDGYNKVAADIAGKRQGIAAASEISLKEIDPKFHTDLNTRFRAQYDAKPGLGAKSLAGVAAAAVIGGGLMMGFALAENQDCGLDVKKCARAVFLRRIADLQCAAAKLGAKLSPCQ